MYQNAINCTKKYPNTMRYLDQLTSQCTQKSHDFELRQQLRAEDREQLQGMEDQLFAALEEVRQLFQLLDA